MAVLDRIRLTGCLQRGPGSAGAIIFRVDPRNLSTLSHVTRSQTRAAASRSLYGRVRLQSASLTGRSTPRIPNRVSGRGDIFPATAATREVFVVSREINPVLAALGYVMLGMARGGVSVFLFPHPLIHPSRIHGISLLVSPVLTGLVMSRIGAALRRYGKHPTQIESFEYGFAFAFGMALVRYLVVK